MDGLERDTLFVGLTRPQLLLGVPYPFAVVNAVATTELFLLFKSPWVLLAAVLVHIAGWLMAIRDPRLFDLWVLKSQRCPRVRNFRLWRCNSYRP